MYRYLKMPFHDYLCPYKNYETMKNFYILMKLYEKISRSWSRSRDFRQAGVGATQRWKGSVTPLDNVRQSSGTGTYEW
jgi:hypothetical protein